MIFNDNYEWMSGWIHDYYCDKDGAGLIFDLNNKSYFECPICHFRYTDEKRKNAWITKYRYEIFKRLENNSKKYLKSKDKDALKFIVDAFYYYTLNYNKFAIHNKDGEIFDNVINVSNKCGRITAQGLNEAMITIQIVNTINNVNSYLNKKIKKDIFKVLFPQIYWLLKPQVNRIHNISCYEICAIGMMGIISNNKEMLEFAFNSSYSFYNQLEKGTTDDYFWFEGSFHYHFFILKPILELLKLAKDYDYKISQKYYGIVKMMLIQGFKCTFNDCSLPSPNDGWPNRSLGDYLEVYNLGNEIFNNEFSSFKENITNKINKTGTIHFLNTGFSMLKNKYWNVFIKYNDNNLGHAHPDKLNIEIKNGHFFLTHDLSTSGYGSNISTNFYKKSYSHNTIVIDGKNQNLECDSNVIFNDNMINIRTKNMYDGISISRKIEIVSNKIIDEVNVLNSNNKNVDYFFHCDAELVTKLDYSSLEQFEEYPYLKNIKKINFKSDNVILKWKLNDKIVNSKIYLKNKMFFICESPNNPDINKRTTLLIKNCSGSDILFKLEWEIF